ncbi:hypothetical protein L6452_12791 [Arctium lappa]|uniref:Uncharacterized protein n=1 Tax=Arctium lappa TaxID=4217 RepID=A0ACB9CGG8_ARCLA|nr:hypothetical protein L6452_12791 [Arctium lappa]
MASKENAVVSAVGPVYNKLKDLPEQIIVFADDKLEKYAPGLAKSLIAKFQSIIDKTLPLVEKLLTKALSIVTPLLTKAQSIVTPLITTAVSLLKKVIETIKSLLQKILDTIKSLPLYGKAKALLEKGLNAIKSLPLVGKAQDLLQTGLATIKSLPLVNTAQSLLQNPADLANQALDTTKSVVGGIPLVGNVAESLITNPLDLADSLVKDNPVIGAAQNIVKEAQSTGKKAALKSMYLSFNVVGLPVIAQFWYKANTYPLFHSLAEVILPVIEKLSEYYNKFVTYMVGKDYELFDYLPLVPIKEMKAAYKVVKMAMDSAAAVGDLAGGLTGGLINNNN